MHDHQLKLKLCFLLQKAPIQGTSYGKLVILLLTYSVKQITVKDIK